VSEATPEATDNGGQQDSGWTPPASQQELNRIIGERVKRAQDKYADYSDLKAKAEEFDKLAQSRMSEVERANERATRAESEVATVPAKVAEALKAHLVELHSINDEDAELFLTATDPGLLLKQIQRLTARGEDRKRQGNFVPREGTTVSAGSDPKREFASELFGGRT
jgi:Lon protease-like protein